MPTEQKHYYAFVSHSSRDAKIALWLRDKLVNYNIPASIRKENQMPKRLRPVFIYQTDLAGANLQDALQRELEDSQWLIVICSPDGAKSQYVNGEVEHFINTGRANRIIPFIVGGTPHAKNPEEECFPPALLKLAEDGIELRGVNLAECQKQLGSKMGAVVNVVATMLGVRFDSMWNVYQRKQRRQQIYAAVIAVLFCIIGFLAWEYWHPRYEYFADYVDKWGVPEGIIPISKEQFKHRHATWQFTYRRTPLGEPGAWKWRVTEVKHVNFAGRPVEIEEHEPRRGRAVCLQLIYNKQTGQVAQYIFSNESGKILLRHVLSELDNKPACVADFMDAKEWKGQGYVCMQLSGFYHHEMEEDYLKSSIVRYVYERNEDGYIIKQTFHTSNDYNLSRSATPDALGIYGFSFTLDSLGRPLRVDYIDSKGKPMHNKQGVAAERYEYDAYSGLSRTQFVNMAGKPILHPDGHWATKCNDYDQWGNASEIYYLDTIGNPYLCSTLGKVTYRYDMYGNRIEEAYWDLDNQPSRWSEYLDYSRVLYVHDKQGRVIVETYWDMEGRPCSGWYGAHKVTYQYDAKGQEIEKAWWDADGKRSLNAYGCSIAKSKYDASGRVIERSYWGTDEQLCNNRDGFAIQALVFDDKGNMIEESYYNADRELCYNDWNDYPKQTNKYDNRGKNIETTFWGTDGELIPDSIGCPRVTRKFDDQGNVTEWAYWDADWQPCSSTRGFARSESVFDERGNEIETAFFGEDGQPCMYEGYAKVKRLFDERGRELEAHFFDKDGNEVHLAGD